MYKLFVNDQEFSLTCFILSKDGNYRDLLNIGA